MRFFNMLFKGEKLMKKIAFIGAGSMAEAIVSGIINKEFMKSEQIWVTNKDNQARLDEMKEKYGISISQDKKEVLSEANIIVLSTKPHDIKSAIKSLLPYLTKDQLIMSVVAGISTTQITQLTNQNTPVIRAMPNTSASIGYSATAISQGEFATTNDLQIAKQLFEAIGTVNVVEEKDMHIVTAISGSGPAYLYYLTEAMEEAAIQEGLDAKTAKELITQTIIGAGNMLKTSELPVNVLRENVTSPQGTTEAGLKALEKNNFKEALIACVESATNRSKELGKKEDK